MNFIKAAPGGSGGVKAIGNYAPDDAIKERQEARVC